MAHIALHFALGLTTGMICLLPRLILSFRNNKQKAKLLAKWLVASYLLGLLAVTPNILRNIGVPEYVCNGWWMNIFFFHHAIDEIKQGGMLIGELLITACFSFQYTMLLVALLQAQSKHRKTKQFSVGGQAGEYNDAF